MKPKSMMDRSELNDSVDKGKALPDMILKRIIFEALDRMNKAEAVLVYNRLKSSGITNQLDVFRLRVAILECWRHIGEMSLEVKCINLYRSQIYGVDDCELITKLYSDKPMNIDKLHHLVGYIVHCLHVLNLTNLLISEVSYETKEEYF
jgi:hypothetical protein